MQRYNNFFIWQNIFLQTRGIQAESLSILQAALPKIQIKKEPNFGPFSSGKTGIRTLGPGKLVNGFRDRPDRPLRHLSSQLSPCPFSEKAGAKVLLFSELAKYFFYLFISMRIPSAARMVFGNSSIACWSNNSGSL